MLFLYIAFHDSITNGSLPYASVTDKRTDGRTSPNEYAPQLFRSWGYKNQNKEFAQHDWGLLKTFQTDI